MLSYITSEDGIKVEGLGSIALKGKQQPMIISSVELVKKNT